MSMSREDRREVLVSPGNVEIVALPASEALPPGHARISVRACGLCGSDHHLHRGMRLPPGAEYPVRPGHEVAGVIVELAQDSTPDRPAVAVGDAVVLHPVLACGTCEACRSGADNLCPHGRMLGIHDPGGLADEMTWPVTRLVPYRDLPAEQAALLPDAVATAYHAWRIAALPPGGTLAVLGAGGIGTHLLQIAAHFDPSARLVAVVRSEGTAARLAGLPIEVVISDLEGSARAVRSAVGTVDVVAEFTGAAAAPAEAVRMVGRGGSVVLGSIVDDALELGVSVAHLVTREISVRSSYSSTMQDLREVVRLAETGVLDLSASVSHRVPLDEAARAFDLLDERPPGLLRVVVTP